MRKLLLALAAATLLTGVSTPAYAVDPSKGLPGFCPDGNGVTVIIDFQDLGGDSIVRCAVGDQATGLAALKNAGIQITGTARWGEAFICRIEGKPAPNAEPCIDTPPASAYWSYWYAPNGGSWKYSEWGVANRKPPLGSFEGWSFSKNRTAETNPPPRIAPQRPGGNPAPGGGKQPPQKPGTSATPNQQVNPLQPSPGLTPTPTATPQSQPPTPPQNGPTAGPGWTGGGSKPLASSADSSDIPLSTILGIALVAALALSAGVGLQVRAFRRRR